MAVASGLTLVALSLEAIFYYGFGSSNVVDWEVRQSAMTLLLLSLTWMWALYAVGLLVVGLVLDKPLARWGGLALLTVALVKLLLIDTFLALPDAETYIPGIQSALHHIRDGSCADGIRCVRVPPQNWRVG